MNATRPASIALFMLLAATSCASNCQLGGGMTADSVTVPGEDGTTVKADAAAEKTTAQLVLKRWTNETKSTDEATFLFAKTRVSQQLTLDVNGGGEDLSFVVSSGNEASTFGTYQLSVAPDGKRVAYKLGEEPWRFVYLLTSQLAVHGPREESALDWDEVPTLSKDFVAVFDAQSLQLNDMYRYTRKGDLLTWRKAHGGEPELIATLFELVPKRDLEWPTQVLMLTEKGRQELRDRLRDAVATGKTSSPFYSRALDLNAVDVSKLSAEAVAAGTKALREDPETLNNDGLDLAEFLRVHASHDPKGAAKIGCELISIRDKLMPEGTPFPLSSGRPLQLVAHAVVASAKLDCPSVEVPTDCNKTARENTAQEILRTRLEMPETGQTAGDPEALARLQCR